MRAISFGGFGSFLGSVVGVLLLTIGAPRASAGGDPAAGKANSVACEACHVAVAPTADTPHLVGQRETYIVKQLKAFKKGDRKHPVMNAIAGALNDADIDNLAAYWSSQPPGSDATASEAVAAIKKSKMAFPRDFPKGFVQYGARNKEDQNLVARAYVNNIGLAAAKAGKQLPDGSVVIVINYAAKLDASGKPVAEADGIWATDQIKGYEGMEARAGWGKDIPELIRNTNWNYAVFSPDKAQRAEVNQAICLSCHIPAASTGFVFGLKKIQTKAGAK